MYKALTIAGSDSGGGAGIQADLKTFTAFGVYGMSALTAITAQNTIGVQGVYEITPEFVYEQIKSIMSDIGTDAVKTGMLANPAIVKKVAQAVEEFHIPILVVDPVMIAKSGDPLLSEDARKTVKELLIPLATVITPNLYDVVYNGEEYYILKSQRFETKNTHGTGCTFSSAIAAGLAKGYSPLQAIRQAKKYIADAIEHNINIGQGHGPTNHLVGVESIW
jgi:hydroxymethylpyrimidine/phosphomethylpyrimidine kinase